MTLAARPQNPMKTQRRSQIRGEGLVDLLGHLHARVLAGDSSRLEYGAAVASCGDRLQWRNASWSSTTSLMSPVGVVPPATTSASNSIAPWAASGRRSPYGDLPSEPTDRGDHQCLILHCLADRIAQSRKCKQMIRAHELLSWAQRFTALPPHTTGVAQMRKTARSLTVIGRGDLRGCADRRRVENRRASPEPA
jgi:hypothetical protein